MQLEGQVAAITGGTRGIGRAIAEAIVAEGGKVALNGRSPDKGAQALEEMAAGDQAIFVQGDVQQQESVNRLVDTTVDTFGTIDIMVNNAGGSGGFAPVAQLSDDAWEECLNWCLNATFWGSRRALQTMEQNGSGTIINVSSMDGRRAEMAAISHYITNKHAIIGLTRATAFEYGPMGITCNALCPGAIETDIMKSAGPEAAKAMGITYEEFRESYAEKASIKRLNTVEEVAALAVFLCTDSGSGFNGAVLDISGGTVLS